MATIIERADAFAERAHGSIGQLRKYTGDPYIVHPRAVAETLKRIDAEPDVIAAALLHDVVEDTPVIAEEVRVEFGERIAGWVASMTDVAPSSGLNREARVRLNLARLADADDEVHTIKLADLIDNASSIVMHDPGWARHYLAEKRRALHVLGRGHPELLSAATVLVEDGLRSLSAPKTSARQPAFR